MVIPEDYRIFKFLVFDPGSYFCGCTEFYFDLVDKRIIDIVPSTIKTDRLLYGTERREEFIGAIFARHERLYAEVFRRATQFRPHAAVIESPFFYQKMPGAYGSLCATVNTIHTALFSHNPFLPVTMFSPKEVKKQIGSKMAHLEKGKLDVATCVKLIPEITAVLNDLAIDDLDEHSVDTLAIGYHFLKVEGYFL